MGEKQLNNINFKKEEEKKKTPWTNKLPGASDELEARHQSSPGSIASWSSRSASSLGCWLNRTISVIMKS